MKKKLSTREFQVLNLLESGLKNKAISQELNINEKTISTYKARISEKLGVPTSKNDYYLIIKAKQSPLYLNKKVEIIETIDAIVLNCGCCGHKNGFTPDCAKCGNKL